MDKDVKLNMDSSDIQKESDAVQNSSSTSNTSTSGLSGTLLLTTVAGVSLLGGFGFTVALAKKQDPTMFNKGLTGGSEMAESGGSLALRALRRGTLYAFTGFAVFGFALWKYLGVKNMQEFREKMRSHSVKQRKDDPQEYKDIKTLHQLADYIVKRGEIEKRAKSALSVDSRIGKT